ncbi:MAG: ABC transporter ATP-binding protein [bacterium]|nr:MAG: ABC transporter ATP-binding protein [bacterium]
MMEAVKAENLNYSYPDGTRALRDISLSIGDGEKVAVVGPNGSGKSTFLTMLNGVRKGTGLLEIFGHPMNRENVKVIKQLVGIVFQNPDDQLFCPTLFEDISFGPLNQRKAPEEVRTLVELALREVGLIGMQHRSSFHLSFGERKLASIATVAAMYPSLIALDEPTSNLDMAHRRKIIHWVQKNSKTIILTSHDLDMILETCQRVILFNKGSIVKDGTVQEILHDEALLTSNDLELPLGLQK